MAYDKKYIEDGDFVDEYLNDREDRIEGAFEGVGDKISGVEDDLNIVKGDVSKINEALSNFRMKDVSGSGETSNGGDRWVTNPGHPNSAMVFSIASVSGYNVSEIRVHEYKQGNAHYVRIFDGNGATIKNKNIAYTAVLIEW